MGTKLIHSKLNNWFYCVRSGTLILAGSTRNNDFVKDFPNNEINLRTVRVWLFSQEGEEDEKKYLCELLELASKFQVDSLKDECFHLLSSSHRLSLPNALSLAALASRYDVSEPLKQRVTRFCMLWVNSE